jgi:hypothetical protein
MAKRFDIRSHIVYRVHQHSQVHIAEIVGHEDDGRLRVKRHGRTYHIPHACHTLRHATATDLKTIDQ